MNRIFVFTVSPKRRNLDDLSIEIAVRTFPSGYAIITVKSKGKTPKTIIRIVYKGITKEDAEKKLKVIKGIRGVQRVQKREFYTKNTKR